MEVTNLGHEPCWSPIDPVQVSMFYAAWCSIFICLASISSFLLLRCGNSSIAKQGSGLIAAVCLLYNNVAYWSRNKCRIFIWTSYSSLSSDPNLAPIVYNGFWLWLPHFASYEVPSHIIRISYVLVCDQVRCHFCSVHNDNHGFSFWGI